MNWDRIVYFLVEQFVEGIRWFVRLVVSRFNTERKTDGGYRQRCGKFATFNFAENFRQTTKQKQKKGEIRRSTRDLRAFYAPLFAPLLTNSHSRPGWTRPSAAVFPYIVSRERSHSQRVMRVGRHHAGPTFPVGGGGRTA